MKKRLITSALPYVNNIPHLGNLMQVLSADVFARFCRLRGYETMYVCGTDEYGTASETRALQEGVTPRELCDHYHEIHKKIYSWFNISFDYFGRTSTPLQTEIVQHIFSLCDQNGYITEKETEQLYCPHCDRFLADRFVSGTCPHCGYEGARGDQCEKCGTLLDPTDLIDAKCSVCGSVPVLRKTKNLYINLPKILPIYKEWLEKASVDGFWAKNAVQITTSWLRDGLQERCITRDLKWGIPVNKPGYENKVFYVWFDAPIGYISITANKTKDWEYWWRDPENTELYQFIGKDNIPFHTVVFPCSLLATGEKWTMLYHMSSTEYLNYEGGKFSKSKGIGIFGNDVEETGIPADVWRFYMFYNRPEKSDFTFTWADFQEKVNKELIGNLSNLVNRTLTFVKRFYNGSISSKSLDESIVAAAREKEEKITEALERADERDAIRLIFELSDIGNKAFQDGEPWKKRKESPEEAERLLGTLLYLLRDLGVMIQPYMPETGRKILSFLSADGATWESVGTFEGKVEVGEPELLFQKLEDERIKELRERYSGSQQERMEREKEDSPEEGKKMEMEKTEESLADQFARRVILKVAKIVKVEKHPGGDKLYILTLDVKEEEPRVIVSSIVPFYREDELLNHNIVLVSNLKPANFRGVKSRGMLLAASDPTAEDPHSTCEVIFADDIEPGTVLKAEGEGEVEKVTTYIKPDHFFAMPMKTIDGYVTIDEKKLGSDGVFLRVSKYVNGNVG
ncbi:MAG: methionine--tRNA ligase [Spirochaetes bacterium]|uniref:Methionine--tRNA ligase n=1 Tax=Candidatus Ornithospirochaeta stercoripullorum TaxID=2840899 RepID=A0A9D9DYT9_9SPIO|nr:methionine--tRNA ligase [Candidatus Ornithospirochaeta stercoripullorum]